MPQTSCHDPKLNNSDTSKIIRILADIKENYASLIAIVSLFIDSLHSEMIVAKRNLA